MDIFDEFQLSNTSYNLDSEVLIENVKTNEPLSYPFVKVNTILSRLSLPTLIIKGYMK
jgi:hypothetical protein